MYKIGFKYAIRNIVRTPIRSLFTIFSIAMIISMYTLLTAVADSFSSQFKKLLNKENVDIIIQSKYSVTPLSSSISYETLKSITSSSAIAEYIAIVIDKKRYKDRTIIYLLGMNNFNQVSNRLGINLKDGKNFSVGSNEILMADKLLKMKKLKIDDEIVLTNNKFKIVGTYHSWISFFNSSIIGDLEAIRKLIKKENKTNMLFLILNDGYNSEKIIQDINKNFSNLQAIKSSEFSETLGAVKNIFYLSDIISIITLIVASAILINTFLIAIYERIKEIGILSAIGWSRLMIIYMFVVESTFLALLGGISGFIISMALLYYLQISFTAISIYLPANLDLVNFLYTIFMSFLIGVLSVILPAIYATKISIAKAIHHE